MIIGSASPVRKYFCLGCLDRLRILSLMETIRIFETFSYFGQKFVSSLRLKLDWIDLIFDFFGFAVCMVMDAEAVAEVVVEANRDQFIFYFRDFTVFIILVLEVVQYAQEPHCFLMDTVNSIIHMHHQC